MAWIARAMATGKRDWASVLFYRNGHEVDVWSLIGSRWICPSGGLSRIE